MKKESKKDRIIDAAVHLFSSKGYYKATVSQIAEEAGVAKGTVYWYFESKKELFQEILLTGIYDLIDRITARIENEQDALKKIEIVVELLLKFYEDSKQYSKMFQEGVISAIDQEFQGKMLSLKEQQVSMFKSLVKDASEQGQIRDDIDIEDTAYLLMGMVNIFNPHICIKSNVKARVETIMKVFINGVVKK